ncbi:MAG TPA: Ig-like domain-containing protein, partial [Roseiflexaceae bacterium]|nr:Ig-like domain-containing protein [Roseiflexaceae bacterium]
AQDVQADSTITVLFSRPVVPFTAAESQGNAPQPLSFDPSISGQGVWLSTAIYVFHPSVPLAGGTTYTGHIAAGLADVDGNPLQSEYTWRFTTARPQVAFTSPQDGAMLVSVEPQIQLQFNQQIGEASARTAFHLRSDAGVEVAGTMVVVSDTLIFTPVQRLDFDRGYRIELAAGLSGRGGGAGMSSDYAIGFHTVPLPRILSTTPADGDQSINAYPFAEFTIQFNAPVDPGTVMGNIQITPPLSSTQVYTHFDTIANIFHLGFGGLPSTEYQVHIGSNIADPYGNLTGQTINVHFRTDRLPSMVRLITSNSIVTYNAQAPARVGLGSVNVPSATLSLYGLAADDLKQPYQDWKTRTVSMTVLRRWQTQIDASLDKITLSRVDLVEGGGHLDPGAYLLLLDQPQGEPQPLVLVVSSLNLTLKAGERDALVWANDLQTGQPVPNLALELFDEQGAPLGTATTDADGVATIHINRTENRGVLAMARQPFAAAASSWSAGISPWELGLPMAGDLPEMTAHIYTDRPIYRPGQTVNFKGVLRAENDAHFSLPTGLSNVQVTIRSANGEQIEQQSMPLSLNGTFDGSLNLTAGAALGPYNIEVLTGQQSFGASFQVAAYRAPEFQVTVTPQTKEIVRGASTSATAEVSYFFGGPVANAPVTWNVLAETYRFAPDWAGRYQFNDSDDPWRCWDCWWLPNVPPQPILHGSGTTDAQDRLRIDIPAALKDTQNVPITGSARLTIEATATGRDNQVISGRSDLIVHSGRLYIGLASQTYVGRAKEEQKIDLVTADTQGRRLPNQALDV